MKIVDLGYCHTCGRKVDATVDWEMFITPVGTMHTAIKVEGHCGVAGHAMKVGSVGIEELDELPDWDAN